MVRILFCIIFQLLLISCLLGQFQISIDTTLSPLKFAFEEIQKATPSIKLEVSNSSAAGLIFTLSKANDEIEKEGFKITNQNEKIEVRANTVSGLLYGGLEIAEQLKTRSLLEIRTKTENPYMRMRGTKMNIPLDVRTPSYTDASDVAQANIAEMWSFDFWKEYIDELARNRYNFISLWSLHPFPSLVKVPDYEDIALADIHRSSKPFDEYHHLHGTGLATPAITSNPEVVKKMTIEEKIEFWKSVMAYAKNRNIKFYIINWNIFINGTEGKYGITDDVDNETTRDYFRKSIKQLFRSYPDLAGIGLTTGENMHGLKFEQKEEWAFDTYARALLEVAKEQPSRQFTLIHRQHQTGATDIATKFKPVFDAPNIEFLFSFKYAKAHVMSATTQHYHPNFVKEIQGKKTIWTLRNDSNYLLRWGAPDFVREFINNIPQGVTEGMYYGSDQWVWGREFTSLNPKTPRELEIKKHWYHWMMWGRLAYNPELSNNFFIEQIESRFGIKDGTSLLESWQEASMVYPTITGFHWGPVDFKWYPEACRSRPAQANNKTGFHDVNTFINLPPHPMAGMMSIKEYLSEEKPVNKLTPLEVSAKLLAQARSAQEKIDLIKTENTELLATLHDIRTMAAMGEYYAYKIAGSSHLAQYRNTKDPEHQAQSIADLQKALEAWTKYENLMLEANINRFLTNRVGYVDFKKTREWVEADITLAKETID